MNFDPVAYINGPQWQDQRLGLWRIEALLELLGKPQDRLRFVHVAGTNGKGSTCAYIASVLQRAGLCTGVFTSPFIETFEERIRINGVNISWEDLTQVTLKVKDQAEKLAQQTGDHPTEFELMTAVAFEYFAQKGCDVVVCEVGLGGRLDSTNVISAPVVAVIARIGLDHTAFLGTTLAAIAQEKAGIIKDGSVVVSWPQEKEAMDVIVKAAHEHNATLYTVDLDQLDSAPPTQALCSPATNLSDTPSEVVHSVSYESVVRKFSYKGIAYTTSLLGSYQPANAALALEALEVLRRGGWDLSDRVLYKGIEQARWPGRFEILPPREDFPLTVIDGGHNPQGACALVDSLKEVFPSVKPVFIIGVLEDKDYPVMLETVLPYGAGFICVAPPNLRALSARKLAQAIRWTGQDLLGCAACTRPVVAHDFGEALSKGREMAQSTGLLCIFGSLYNIAPVKAAYNEGK